MTLRQDLTWAVRSLRGYPLFACGAIGTLALGLGATLAVFTVVARVACLLAFQRNAAVRDVLA